MKLTRAFIIVVFGVTSAYLRGDETALTLGQGHQGELSAAEPARFSLLAQAQDYESISIALPHARGSVRVRDDHGHELRTYDVDGVSEMGFVAPETGPYQIELQGDAQSSFNIRWSSAISEEDRLRKNPPAIVSPYLTQLRRNLANKSPNALNDFWAEAQTKGTPLIEPLADDSTRMLVTFLWRARPGTRRVTLDWESWLRLAPDQGDFSHLNDSDVWYLSIPVVKTRRFYYKLVENGFAIPHADSPDVRPKMKIRQGMAELDPLNPHRFDDSANPGSDHYGGASFVEMPSAPPEPWIQDQQGGPKGHLTTQVFLSKTLQNERLVSVYTPPGYEEAAVPYPVIFLTDGDSYLRGQCAENVFNHFIAARQIPPIVAVLIHNAIGVRNNELSCSIPFETFIVSEIVPWARAHYHISNEPRRTIIGGLSLGGLTATYLGYRHSDIFGNVLAQSGSFWFVPTTKPNPAADRNEAEPSWLTSKFIESVKLPLRFYLSAGLDELDMRGKGASILIPNRHLRDVLRAKGYDVTYEEVEGAHDSLNWRDTFPHGLIALAKGF